MIERPFPIAYLAARAPRTLRVRASLQDGSAPDEATLARQCLPMKAFAEVAALGGFAGEQIPPLESGATLVELPRPGASEMEWAFERVNVDAGALFVLENLLHQLHLQGHPLSRVSIETDLLPAGTAVPQQLPFVYEPLPFEYSYESIEPDVLIELEFEALQEEPARRSFEQAYRAWLDLAVSGGFAEEPFLPGEMSIFPADEPVSYPTGMEIYLEDVAVSDQAFDALVNMCHVLHYRAAKLRSMIIH